MRSNRLRIPKTRCVQAWPRRGASAIWPRRESLRQTRQRRNYRRVRSRSTLPAGNCTRNCIPLRPISRCRNSGSWTARQARFKERTQAHRTRGFERSRLPRTSGSLRRRRQRPAASKPRSSRFQERHHHCARRPPSSSVRSRGCTKNVKLACVALSKGTRHGRRCGANSPPLLPLELAHPRPPRCRPRPISPSWQSRLAKVGQRRDATTRCYISEASVVSPSAWNAKECTRN
mmetsp:Transcript_94912/g.268002  ORF Transcript_94912/g.268002 Transcript_94912/m.268002 type:complete len:232 (-) Transcript_94912:716-1411(-)